MATLGEAKSAMSYSATDDTGGINARMMVSRGSVKCHTLPDLEHGNPCLKGCPYMHLAAHKEKRETRQLN